MIRYRTQFGKIEALEVVRETDKQVVRMSGKKEQRENKESSWSNWHETWEAAHAYLISEAERQVEAARIQLSRANGKLGQIKGMKKPDGVE